MIRLLLLNRLLLIIAQCLGWVLGYCFYVFPNRYRQVTITNLRLVYPDLTPAQLRQMVLKSCVEAGKTVFEILLSCCLSGQFTRSLVVEGQPPEPVPGRAMIFISPHLGNWEVMNAFMGAHYQMRILYKTLQYPWADRWMRYVRQRHGTRLISVEDGGGLKAIAKAMDRYEVLGLLPDQVPKGKGRVSAPFMHQQAWTGTLVPKLMQKKQPVVTFVYAERLPWARGFKVHFLREDPPVDGNTADYAAWVNAGISRLIAMSPTQYTWTYKRFKGTEKEFLYKDSSYQQII